MISQGVTSITCLTITSIRLLQLRCIEIQYNRFFRFLTPYVTCPYERIT